MKTADKWFRRLAILRAMESLSRGFRSFFNRPLMHGMDIATYACRKVDRRERYGRIVHARSAAKDFARWAWSMEFDESVRIMLREYPLELGRMWEPQSVIRRYAR